MQYNQLIISIKLAHILFELYQSGFTHHMQWLFV